MELQRREQHLLSGLGIQVIVVALLVFAYSQAARQLTAQYQTYLQLKEQVARARDRVAREGVPDLGPLKAELLEMERSLATPEMLSEGLLRLENIARDRFGFRDIEIKVGPPEKTIRIPRPPNGPDFEVQLISLELQGNCTTRQTAGLLARIGQASLHLVCSLQTMTLTASNPDQPLPVNVRLKWLVAASGSALDAQPPTGHSPGFARVTPTASGEAPKWGSREEPFRSPFLNPGAVRMGPQISSRFRLTGILWDSQNPSCVVNESVLKVGDLVQGHRLVLLTPSAALLEGSEGEIILFLP